MKAIVFHQYFGVQHLKLGELPMPERGHGAVVLRVRAGGANWVDILARRGSTRVTIPLPRSSGSEVAGETAQVGPAIVDFQGGQAVA